MDSVHPAWDLVHAEWRASLGVALANDVDAKVTHEFDGHVDVQPGDDGHAGEDKRSVLLGVEWAEEDGGGVLGGDGGIEGEGAA